MLSRKPSRLARRNVPFDALEAGRKVAPEHSPNMARAFAQERAERVLNAPPTEGTVNALNTPMARDAASVALGDRARIVADAVGRERVFNRLPRALGGTTTARQLEELGNPALDAMAGAAAAGGDFLTAGALSAGGRLLRRGLEAAARGASTNSQRATAPHIAERLVGRGVLPGGRPFDKSLAEMWAAAMQPGRLSRMLLGSGYAGVNAVQTQDEGLSGSFQ
jgi:hypothetical protein